VEVLRRGGVIVYPTGTVYGLGCDIHQKRAVERIYQIRRLKTDHPLSFMCADLSKIARYAYVDDSAYRIMKRLVPGPYTFVLRATREVPKLLVRKQKTVGIRVPNDVVAQALLQELGSPIVSTSAMIDGQVLNDPDELHARFPQVDAFVDAGWGGIEPSTIVDLTGSEPVVLREGAGPVDAI
jgi:tRNA threonylcarbamoyl adenosine modification protein (Sua5/YciO/YrdC/YwlC family)